MLTVLHKNACITPAVRAEVAASSDSAGALTRRFGVTTTATQAQFLHQAVLQRQIGPLHAPLVLAEVGAQDVDVQLEEHACELRGSAAEIGELAWFRVRSALTAPADCRYAAQSLPRPARAPRVPPNHLCSALGRAASPVDRMSAPGSRHAPAAYTRRRSPGPNSRHGEHSRTPAEFEDCCVPGSWEGDFHFRMG